MRSSVLLVLLCSAVYTAGQTTTAPGPNAPDASKPIHLGSEAAAALIEKKLVASYPLKAGANGVEGTVVLNVLISEAGAVNESTVSSGDPDLAQAAIDAIKQWKYKPYSVDGKRMPVETQVRFGFHRKGPPYSFDQEEATSFPLSQAIPRTRVSSSVTAGLALKTVEPAYPQELRDARIQGTVALHAIIDTKGDVTGLKAPSGPQEFFPSAIEAVRQWKYRPYLLKGGPIELDRTIEITYRLTR